MVNVGVAVGVGVGAFVLVCCFCWGASKLRQSFKTGRVGATLEEILVERRKGIKKDVVRTFPIVETSELNFETNTKLQCPICWLQFRETDTVRQLPHCDHVFHRHCIDPVLENQITCPVCGTILSDNPKKSEQILSKKNKKTSPVAPYQHQVSLRSLYSIKSTSTAESSPPAIPSPASPPSWVLVNRPVPLPHTKNDRLGSSDRFEIELNPSDSYGGSGKAPLLSKYLAGVEEWQSNDIELDQNCIDISFTFGTEVPVEKRKPGNPIEKGVDTFSFTPPGGKPTPPSSPRTTMAPTTPSTMAPTMVTTMAPTMAMATTTVPTMAMASTRRGRGNESASFSDGSTKFSRSTSRSSGSTSSSSDSRSDKFDRWDHAQPHLEDVAEGSLMSDHHVPLTRPPDQCSFDMLPVISVTDELQRKGLQT